MKFRILIGTFFLTGALSAQDIKGKTFINHYGPGELKSLCASTFTFTDTNGFYTSGCEAHIRSIGEFTYTTDSASIYCSFLPYVTYQPYKKIVRKKVEGQKHIQVMVFDVTGKALQPEIAVIKLRRKRDKVIKHLHSNDHSLNFSRYFGKRMFWTIDGLYPLFFAELHFSFDQPYNYYEIYLSLPSNCVSRTDGKVWVVGDETLTVTDPCHLSGKKVTYMLDILDAELKK
jgi:hypothetical protein